MTLEKFTHDPRARCMDDTASGVYVNANQQSDIFVLYLQSGGWCWDEGSCKTRCQKRPRYCSSNSWSAQEKMDGIFSNDPTKSPVAKANKFYLKYCTSDAHMGARTSSAFGFRTPFRGQHTVRAALHLMVNKYGLGKKGRTHTLLFGGASAGSRGAMVHLDYVDGILRELGAPNVRTRGFLDSPYWIDKDPLTSFDLREVYAVARISRVLPEPCTKKYAGEEWKCAFAEFRLPFMRTPYMMIASQFDWYQLWKLMGISHQPRTSRELEYTAEFAEHTRNGMLKLADNAPTGSVFYSMACYSHATSQQSQFYTTMSNGVTMSQALARFLNLPMGIGVPRVNVDTCSQSSSKLVCGVCASTDVWPSATLRSLG